MHRVVPLIAETQSSLRLSVVVPCFNEQESVFACWQRLVSICNAEIGDSYELVFVNDGSTDGTLDILRQLVSRDSHMVVVDLSRNHGHQLALSAGLSMVRGEAVLIIDADLQDPPELLPEMMCMLEEGADVVYGQRRHRNGESWFKKWTAKKFYRLIRALSEVDIPVDTGDFRLMRRCVVQVLMSMPETHRFIRGMIAWIGFTQKPILYTRDVRFSGTTKYPLKRMLRLAFDAVTGFSVKPLRLAYMFGAFSAIAAIALAIYIFYGVLHQQTIPGWASTVLIILFLGSVQLFCLAIIGEYVGRIFEQSKGRPIFVIKEVILGCSDIALTPPKVTVKAVNPDGGEQTSVGKLDRQKESRI